MDPGTTPAPGGNTPSGGGSNTPSGGSPKTGDSRLVIWVVLAVILSAAVFVVTYRKFRKNEG